jgi:hypothetical protein
LSKRKKWDEEVGARKNFLDEEMEQVPETNLLQSFYGHCVCKTKEKLMTMEAVIVYKGALAYYAVVQENNDIYSAYLNRYDGPGQLPVSVTLAKSLRHWTGSVDDTELLYELGRAIERNKNADSLFPGKGNDSAIMDNLV